MTSKLRDLEHTYDVYQKKDEHPRTSYVKTFLTSNSDLPSAFWNICMMYIKRKTSHDHDLTSIDPFWAFDLENSLLLLLKILACCISNESLRHIELEIRERAQEIRGSNLPYNTQTMTRGVFLSFYLYIEKGLFALCSFILNVALSYVRKTPFPATTCCPGLRTHTCVVVQSIWYKFILISLRQRSVYFMYHLLFFYIFTKFL